MMVFPWARSLRLPQQRTTNQGLQQGFVLVSGSQSLRSRCQQACVPPTPSRSCPLAFLGSRSVLPGCLHLHVLFPPCLCLS